MKKRLFIGTFADNSLFRDNYPNIKDKLNDKIVAKWVELNNLHFTYKFLGDVEEDMIPELGANLKGILKRYNEPLMIKGINSFPNVHKPRVIFAKFFSPKKFVFELNNEIADIIERLGFEKEKTNFRPHITLARVKKIKDNPFMTMKNFKDVEFGRMNHFEVNLIESTLTQKGPIYKKIM